MSDIITELSGGVLRIELNRPARKNAMTAGMYTAVAEALRRADEDDAVRVVLFLGAGRDFCAGNDIGDFLDNPPGSADSPQARLMHALIAFGKPIVAAVQGAAVGGGTTMLTHFDFVYASENATFRVPFVDLGLVPEFGSSYAVPARAGHLRAAQLFMLGEPFSAAHAAELGLVTRVLPDAYLLATAIATAHKLAAKPGGALSATKRLLKRAWIDPLREAVKAENEEFGARLVSPEAKEALNAFVEKRPLQRVSVEAPAGAG